MPTRQHTPISEPRNDIQAAAADALIAQRMLEIKNAWTPQTRILRRRAATQPSKYQRAGAVVPWAPPVVSLADCEF